MNIEQSIFLGLVQGLAEFLPISSSGHLVFFQHFFALKEAPIFFDVMVHVGTLLAVVVLFRSDIGMILQGLGATLGRRENDQHPMRLLLWIIVAIIPTGLIGLLFKDWLESFFSTPKIVGWMLLVNGLVLWLTRRGGNERRFLSEMTWIDALLIGIAQGVAIIPGISRSGVTISMGLFRGLDRELAGRFSFLLSIPAILGAALLEYKKIDSMQELWVTLIGTVVAFGVGILSLTVVMRIIKLGKISNFSYYCWIFGMVMIIL